MLLWLMMILALGVGIRTLRAAIVSMANLSLTCVRDSDTVSCELRWSYPFGIVHKNQIPKLHSVKVDARPLPRSGSQHWLVLNPDEPSWPFGPLKTKMTRDSAWAAESQLEKFLKDPTRETLVLELSERSLWVALILVALGTIAFGPFVYAVWLQVR